MSASSRRGSRAKAKQSSRVSSASAEVPESESLAESYEQALAHTNTHTSTMPPESTLSTDQRNQTEPTTIADLQLQIVDENKAHTSNKEVPDQDDRSSSLSDLEDRMATDGADNQDKSSQLSEEEEVEKEEEDTDAETERLEDSPHKFRKHKTVHLSSLNESTENTATAPSSYKNAKLAGAQAMDNPMDDNTRSPRDQIDQTSDISSLEDSAGELSRPLSPAAVNNKKRKRPSLESPGEIDPTAESLKRVSVHLANHVEARNGATENLPSTLFAGETDRLMEEEEEEASVENGVDTPHESSSGLSKRKLDDLNTVEAPESNDEDMEDAQGAEADATARSEEELLRKKVAMDSLSTIEKQFAVYRDKLYEEKDAQLNKELEILQQPKPTHPIFLAMVECLERRRSDKMELAAVRIKYKLQALQRKSIAERAQCHSQFMQQAREIRDDLLEQTNKEWYQKQRERRNRDQEEANYLYQYSKDRAQVFGQATAYNKEVSILSGFATYVGFPAAPEILGAKASEIDDDLRKMGITQQQPSIRLSSQFSRQRSLAEEQFIQQNPWANPQHPVNHINAAQRQMSQHARPFSPFTTPAAQHRPNDATTLNGTGSTIPALPSGQNSSVAPTPMSVERNGDVGTLHLGNSIETPSKTFDERVVAAVNLKKSREQEVGGAAIPTSDSTNLQQPSHVLFGPPHDAAHLMTSNPTSLPRVSLSSPVREDRSDMNYDTAMHSQFPSKASMAAGVEVGTS